MSSSKKYLAALIKPGDLTNLNAVLDAWRDLSISAHVDKPAAIGDRIEDEGAGLTSREHGGLLARCPNERLAHFFAECALAVPKLVELVDEAAAELRKLRAAAETNGDWRSMNELVPTVEPPTFVLIAEKKPDDTYVVGEARYFGDQGWRWAGNDPTDHWGREVYPEYWMPLPAPPRVAVKTGDQPCTCHPDDNPPQPCPKKYALTECRKAAAFREQANALALECAQSTRQAAHAINSDKCEHGIPRRFCTAVHQNGASGAPMRIVRKKFKAWLARHKNMSFYPNEPCMCPLACYLTEIVGQQVTVMSPDAYSDDWAMTLPLWATEFVDAFDALGTRAVLGHRALAIL